MRGGEARMAIPQTYRSEDMTSASERQPETVELARNYGPLGTKAVRAAVAIKGQNVRLKDVARPTWTGLPEGFH